VAKQAPTGGERLVALPWQAAGEHDPGPKHTTHMSLGASRHVRAAEMGAVSGIRLNLASRHRGFWRESARRQRG